MPALTPIPNDARCRRKCIEWKDLINFLKYVPQYYIADRCKTCLIWFPKSMVVKCPCCHQRVRTVPNRRLKTYLPESKIKQIIKEAIDKGWTLLKNDRITKQILEYERITHEYKRLR